MAMYGNGVPTGMALILQPLKPIPQALQQVHLALLEAAPGPTMPYFAVQPIAASTTHPTSTTTGSDSVWLSPPSFCLVES